MSFGQPNHPTLNPVTMSAPQYYKFTTADGRAFYLLSEQRARNSAAKWGGMYHGAVSLSEVRSVYLQALGSK